ncbi:long-chain acyl-CoA synthetase [Paenibacillus forsythiae]|uniref:Long-chain acyl-CoA synthetase n=1 Tax=Paenibacillus forsythiae TaxID=365616 RepID=A0ABU3HC13_9BACL|nr:class I adenylate-forming enzyme family protein [Paenibacillus forsythiae]MDT3427996.1 long-chain acyl-CoA synthetase [Paenibacillus forsythiae]
MIIIDELERRAFDSPDRPFIRTDEREWKYADFFYEVGCFASYLTDICGVAAGDRVVLCFPNEVEYLIAYFACWYINATVMPVDFDIREQTLLSIVQDANPKLILFSRQRTAICEVGEAATLIFPESKRYMCLVPAKRAHIASDSVALIMYTSGTTGLPKGVVLSHGTVTYTARKIIEWSEMKSDNCEATVLRLTHSFGLGHVHCSVMLGSSIYLLDSLREPQKLIHTIANHNITGIPATPAMIHLLLTYHRRDFQEAAVKLDYIIINTSPITGELVQDLLDLIPGTRVYMYYGLTEASRTTYIAYRLHPEKLESVGKPPEGVQVRLAPTTDEVQIRGLNVMSGYLNNKVSFTEDGWFATGDIGKLDEEGLLYITGRIKEQINMDGLKINPIEVERVINSHPQVLGSMVFGVTDSVTYEKAVAVVTVRDFPEQPRALFADIKKWCKSYLEPYKIPKEFQIWNELPKTDSGKPKRVEARKRWENGGRM